MSRISINTNISSLNAQRSLGLANSKLESSFTRLSSGLRINKASDDAAGLAVASLLDFDKKVYNQGIRNLNDGVSFLNIAESALNEMSNIVIRIQELAEQSANGTLSNTQRAPLQNEVEALQSEYNRILNTTKFNGMTLLKGENTLVNLQGGFGETGGFGVQIGKALTSDAFGTYSAGETTLVSTNSSGQQLDAAVTGLGTLSGGTKFAFITSATNAISGVTGSQLYIKDIETGVVSLASSDNNGVAGNGSTTGGGLSADGRYVSFITTSTNIISGVSGTQAYIKDLQTGIVSLASSDAAGIQGNGVSGGGGLSSDGRYVNLTSTSTNLVSGATGTQFYRKDMLTGEIKLSTSDASWNPSNGTNSTGSISRDGKTIVFTSTSTNLISGVSGTQVYSKNLETGAITLASSDASGVMGNGVSSNSVLGGNGEYVTFRSTATNLIAGVSGTQLYRKNMTTGAIELVSSDSNGNAGDGIVTGQGVNEDSRYIAFRATGTNLIAGVSGDHVYRKDMLTGEIALVTRSTSGTASGTATTGNPRISEDGRTVLILSTGSDLTSNDSNGVADVFMRDMSTAGVSELSGMIVNNSNGARLTLDIADRLLNEISLYRAGIGASTSRIDTSLSTLSIASENLSSASSQIKDVDVAIESASLTANTILKQTASEILKQANNQPKIALRLLGEI
jgi:flagellin-like hook-associated protein FlgL